MIPREVPQLLVGQTVWQAHVVSFTLATIAHVPRKMLIDCCGSASNWRLHQSNKNFYGRSHAKCRCHFVPSSATGST